MHCECLLYLHACVHVGQGGQLPILVCCVNCCVTAWMLRIWKLALLTPPCQCCTSLSWCVIVFSQSSSAWLQLCEWGWGVAFRQNLILELQLQRSAEPMTFVHVHVFTSMHTEIRSSCTCASALLTALLYMAARAKQCNLNPLLSLNKLCCSNDNPLAKSYLKTDQWSKFLISEIAFDWKTSKRQKCL